MPSAYRTILVAQATAADQTVFLTHPGDFALDQVVVSVDGAGSYRNRAIGEDRARIYWSLLRATSLIGSGTVDLSVGRLTSSSGPFQPVADDRQPLMLSVTFKDGNSTLAMPAGMTANFTFFLLTQAVP